MSAVESGAAGLAGGAYQQEKVEYHTEEHSSGVVTPPRGESTAQMKEGAPEKQAKTVKWMIAYASVLASVLLFSLDNTIVADIQPSIIESLGEIENLPWVGVAFSLGSISILPWGKAYGVYNIKWMFIISVIIFEVGSVLCGAAPNMTAMILGRVIGGVGGSGVYSGGLTYISVTTSHHERPMFLAGVAIMWGVGSVLGPVIGGAFAVSSATWRWAFYINLVVAAVMAPAFLFCLPSINPRQIPFGQKFKTQDWIGITIFFGGSACYTMAITFGGSVFPFNSGSEIALWVMTGVLLIAMFAVTIFHPLVSEEDKLYPSHFVKRFELVNLQYQLVVASGAMMVSVYYTPLLFQFTRGDGPLEAGVRLLPLICMIVFFAILNGGLMPKFGYHMPWYVFGNALIVVGSALMFTINAETSPSHIYGYTALIGIGVGCFMTAGFAVVQALVPEKDVNNAVGFMSIAQAFGAITLLAIAGSVFQNVAALNISPLIPGATKEDIIGLTAGASSPQFLSLTDDVRVQVVEQITLAIKNNFAILFAGSGLGFILSFFLGRKKLYLEGGAVAA